MKISRSGFTIVELLIVIVVIAILAAISIVAYNGVQQRSKSVAIVKAASDSKRMIESYIVTYDEYPYVGGNHTCITMDTGCYRNNVTPLSENTPFMTNMAKIGNLPKSAPLASDVRGGVMYSYDATRMVNGNSAPAILSFYLPGANTDCNMTALTSEGTVSSNSSSKYTIGDVGGSGTTFCVVSISGPRV